MQSVSLWMLMLAQWVFAVGEFRDLEKMAGSPKLVYSESRALVIQGKRLYVLEFDDAKLEEVKKGAGEVRKYQVAYRLSEVRKGGELGNALVGKVVEEQFWTMNERKEVLINRTDKITVIDDILRWAPATEASGYLLFDPTKSLVFLVSKEESALRPFLRLMASEDILPPFARVAAGGNVCHAVNLSVARLPLFQKLGEYVLIEALERHPIRLLGYCNMPNHWHFDER